ncbi:MAG TPA: FCD domain-containing protein [Acidimicrobiia bacterium]|nr:FCD domain-containing protein [Acidimicrobiia bacterium]
MTARPNMFSPVSGVRISDEIVAQIEAAIAAGTLQEGDRLASERELAEIFGVSRITVRDALRTMEALGLVDIRVGATGGAFVQAPPSEVVEKTYGHMVRLASLDPDEVAEARLAVELNIVTLAVKRATPEDLEALAENIDKGRKALGEGSYDTSYSREFHALLARGAHNRALEMLVRSFRGAFSMASVRAREPAEQAHRRSLDEHERIAACVIARDAPAAGRALADHFARSTSLGSRVEDLLGSAYPPD